MLKRLNRIISTCACLLLFSSGLAVAYDYPFADRYVATVIGTPAESAEVLPKEVPYKFEMINMFPDREVPDILWNFAAMPYSYLQQKGPAPLIFLVAGTGSSFHSANMQVMQKAFYRAGYHVISLSSPTHPSFVVEAATTKLGWVGEESEITW